MDSTLTAEQVESITAKFSQVITDQGGTVQAAGMWDRRRLAYEVKGRREGTYILMVFEGEPALAKELDRVMRISDEVLRHLITRVEPEHIDISRIGQPVGEDIEEEPEEEQAEEAPEESEAAESLELESASVEQAEPAGESAAVEEASASEEPQEPAASEQAAENAQESPAEAEEA